MAQEAKAMDDGRTANKAVGNRFSGGEVVSALYKKLDSDEVAEGAAGGMFVVENVKNGVTFTTNNHEWALNDSGTLIAQVPGEQRKRVELLRS